MKLVLKYKGNYGVKNTIVYKSYVAVNMAASIVFKYIKLSHIITQLN